MSKSTMLMLSLIVGLVSCAAYGQEPNPPRQIRKVAPQPDQRPSPRGFGPAGRVLLLMEALDANKDGQLSKEEIENATAALKTLDKDKDGKLSQEEIGWPPMGRGMRGRGGPGGFGGGRGFGPPGGGPGGPRGFGGGRGAGGPGGFDIAERIMSNDKNNDGKVTKDELPEFMQRMLDRADTNKDGAIDRDEAKAMAENFGRGGPRAGRGGAAGQPPRPADGGGGSDDK